MPARVQQPGDRRVGNMPADLTTFVARRTEIAEVRKRLSDGRLVTLTGVGGVGKTRLALRVAGHVRRAFDDGAWLVDLASLQDSALLAVTVADALDMRDQSSHPSLDTLAEHLRDRHLLLVLDNCEHMLSGCAEFVTNLLRACPGLQILATSREILGLDGEHVFVVPPLDVPAATTPLSDVGRYGATALLSKRIAAVAPDFAVTEQNRDAVIRLCRRLDGIPLAIELAAVRLRSMSVDEVVARLDDRFRLLAEGRRAALPHHQTLQTTFDWSYELCEPMEQKLWAELSVFSGGFDLDAVESICADDELPRDEIVHVLTSLVRKSVVGSDSSGPLTRYRLLETVRQYGLRRLRECGTEQAARLRHFTHYRSVAHELARDWFSVREVDWMAGARRDLPNLRAALEYSITEPDLSAAGLEFSVNLTRSRCWFFIGTLAEGRLWLHRTLELNLRPSALRLSALALNAWLSLVQGDQSAATKLMNKCRALAPGFGHDDAATATVTYVEGAYALLARGAPDAVSILAEARDRFERVGASGDSHMAAMLLAIATAFLADPEVAFMRASECLTAAKNSEAEWAISWAVFTLGLVELRYRRLDSAESLFRDSLRRQRDMEDRWGPVWGVEALAWASGT